MGEPPGFAKLARWVAKRDTFTRREAFLATKGGAMRCVEDFDSALAGLVTEGTIALAAEQPARGVRYIVVSPSGQTLERKTFAAWAAESRSATHSPAEAPSAVNEADYDALIAVAAARRHLDGRTEFLIEQIERRHGGMRLGDTLLHAEQLNGHDRIDLDELARHLRAAR